MYKIAICDDELQVCSDIEKIVIDYSKTSNLNITVEVFYSGEDLISYLKADNTFDVIFLDIELGDINGVSVGSFIRNILEDQLTKIIFISYHDKYDRLLFDVQPLHFLKKPIIKEKLIKDLLLAFKIIEKENNVFCFKKGGEIFKVPYKQIIYFESLNREIKLVGLNGTIIFYGKLEEIQSSITGYYFLCPHRSYYVNINHVLVFRPNEIIMINNDRIPISQGRKKQVKSEYMSYLNTTISNT